MRALLDINVLLALFDTGHQFHARARAWLQPRINDGWASCPLTQNGFIRIASQPAYPNHVSPTQAMALLAEATHSSHHQFWPDTISALDEGLVDRTRIHGPKQLTDAYLLALAVQHGGCFATFDDRVPLSAVRQAKPEHLAIL